MIRIILYRINTTHEWSKGVIHAFTPTGAVIENKETGELYLVPVNPQCLKFEMNTDAWIQLQVEAQQRAQARSVMASPPPSSFDGFRR